MVIIVKSKCCYLKSQQSIFHSVKAFSRLWFLVLLLRGDRRCPGIGRFALSLIFVLCTALLILNPIIYYLNPSLKRNSSSRCVYVNNTKRLSNINGKRQKTTKKKSIKFVGKEHPSWCHGELQQTTLKKISPRPFCSCGSSLECHKQINVVFSALSIYLSSGCIDWKTK